MILGIVNKKRKLVDKLECIRSSEIRAVNHSSDYETYRNDSAIFICRRSFEGDKSDGRSHIASVEKRLAIVFAGQIYNAVKLWQLCGLKDTQQMQTDDPLLILTLYKKFGIDLLDKLNGKFAFGLWDNSLYKLFIARDQIGIESLYYYEDQSVFIFGSSIPLITKFTRIKKELHTTAFSKYLLFNYNPGSQTLFKDIKKLRPAHYLTQHPGYSEIKRYWQIPFGDTLKAAETEIAEQLKDHLKRAVKNRLGSGQPTGIFISGGLDSSTVLSLASEFQDAWLHTFSYRCPVSSFDESHYASAMARYVNAVHCEIEYHCQDLFSMPEVVRDMSEPFCDVGINIATFLLGKAAQGKVKSVLTGDGGDELFGGHPVYEADKIARWADLLPAKIKKLLFKTSALIPDSDQKKNLTVKLKRFTESLAFPSSMLSHRWRIYYHHNELKQLLNTDLADQLIEDTTLEDIFQYTREADDFDPLGKAIYSDYQTVVDFYLRRNDLNRRFGLETHFPLLDSSLVAFCARIPSNLKINGWFDTKYILKKSMHGVLPDLILYRKDKLGHSIPLKIWIREDPAVQKFILDLLLDDKLRKRGLFQKKYIQKLVEDHLTKRRNNSHRLWSLAVLEMWLQEHYDA